MLKTSNVLSSARIHSIAHAAGNLML